MYDLDGALTWLKEIERIFRVMDCTSAQKVWYGTHMLVVEADGWWIEMCQRLETAGAEITWEMFCREFMRKYYPEDVRGKKEIEFLELKQGNKSITEYAAKFVELAKFYPHYSEATAEFSNCQIYEEDNNAHYKIINEKRSKHQQNRGKPYDAPVGKGKQKFVDGKRTSGGDAPAGIVCFKCGKPGHKSNVCIAEIKRCFRYGKLGHAIFDYKHKEMICFNCGEEGHIVSQYHKPKKEQAGGKVFALAGTQTANDDRLIRGTYFINITPLITIIDTCATYFFIAADCAERLGLILSSMNGEMVVDTPATGSMTTSLVYELVEYNHVELVEYNHVHINCYDKLVRFSTPKEEGVDLLSAKQLRLLMKEEAHVFSLMASLFVENQAIIDEL
ncbi:uncharacterized protein LOC131638120 [Vicia villosa]|uniref:uncharacterized protein LOC131638120 n=1 Tax=Vicia villosa TaxID=3911 RepID=UPI00273CBA8A|nr:uncharacterized protein LOC131638120 [Vicia villosa]